MTDPSLPSLRAYPPDSCAEALVADLRSAFGERFGSTPRVFFAPGRVNLIGAHLDYNGGQVLPVALVPGTFVAAAPGATARVRLASLDLAGGIDFDPSQPPPSATACGWAAYAFGVWLGARERGLGAGAVDLCVGGTLPRASGLASSASLTVATALALASVGGWHLSMAELADLAWAAETGYVGLSCGIMDPYAVALGRRGHALALDCRDRRWRHVPIAEDFALLVADTGKPRELVESKFNERVEECEAAHAVLGGLEYSSMILPDFGEADVEEARVELGEACYRRARHVVTEADRVTQAVAALERGDLESLGRLVRASHESSRADYEVSCDELDFLVDGLCELEGVYGARLCGAGFGGCCLAVARKGRVDESATRALLAAYEAHFGRAATIQELALGGGPCEIAESS